MVASLRLARLFEVQAQSRYLDGFCRCRTPEPSDSLEVYALIASQVPGSDTRRVSTPDFAAPSGFLNLLAPYSSQNRPVLFHTVSASRVPFSESRQSCQHGVSAAYPFVPLAIRRNCDDQRHPERYRLVFAFDYASISRVSRQPKLQGQSQRLALEFTHDSHKVYLSRERPMLS